MSEQQIIYGPLTELPESARLNFKHMTQQISDPQHEGWKRSRVEPYFELDEDHLFLHDTPTVFMMMLNTLIAVMLTPMVCVGLVGIHHPIQEGRWGALIGGIVFMGILAWIIRFVARSAYKQLNHYQAEKRSPRAGIYLLPDCIIIRGYECHLPWDSPDYPYQYIPKAAIKEIKLHRSRGRNVASSKEVIKLIFYPQENPDVTERVIADYLFSAMGKSLFLYLKRWQSHHKDSCL